MLRTELQVARPFGGGQWLFGLLLAAALFLPRSADAQTPDEAFLAILGELREADFPTKEAVVDKLSATGHASTRPVLTALVEDRLYFRIADQHIVLVKSAEDTGAGFDLVDPLTLKDAEETRAGTKAV